MLDKITKAVSCAMIPCLDKDFVPATLWDREFRKAVNASGKSKDIVIAVERNPESVSIYPTVVFDNADASDTKTTKIVYNSDSKAKGSSG